MDNLLKVLNSLNNIEINFSRKGNIIYIFNKEDMKSICKINTTKRQYIILCDSNFEDICRILNWFGYKDKENNSNKNFACNGLGCENCSGCSYSSLSSFYKAKVRLNEYISSQVTENFTFIGDLNVYELPSTPSQFKTYIQYRKNEFIFLKVDNKNGATVQNIYNPWDKLEIPMYIEQLIPEFLGLHDFNCPLYGIYNNKAVVWKYIHDCNRLKWTYEEL